MIGALGIIHSNEPKQAVFFNINDLQLLQRLNNPSITQNIDINKDDNLINIDRILKYLGFYYKVGDIVVEPHNILADVETMVHNFKDFKQEYSDLENLDYFVKFLQNFSTTLLTANNKIENFIIYIDNLIHKNIPEEQKKIEARKEIDKLSKDTDLKKFKIKNISKSIPHEIKNYYRKYIMNRKPAYSSYKSFATLCFNFNALMKL